MRELQMIATPKLEYKSIREEYELALRWLPKLRDYFPDYRENDTEPYTP